MKGELGKWFEAIEAGGRQRREEREAIREKIKSLGLPHAEIKIGEEDDIRVCMWRIEDGVLAIHFVGDRADIDNMPTYSDEFIGALVKCKENDEILKVAD